MFTLVSCWKGLLNADLVAQLLDQLERRLGEGLGAGDLGEELAGAADGLHDLLAVLVGDADDEVAHRGLQSRLM